MSPQTFMMVTCGMLVFMAWYANNSLRNKIYCTFRRVNKTKINRFVRMQSRYVIFDGGKYDIIPSRITFLWYTSGLVHWIFPQWVPTLDFSYHSRFPHNPDNMAITAETPATRKALNKEEWVESYYKGAKPQTSKKQNMIAQYLPWVAILLVAMIGFYLYQNQQALANQMAILQNTLEAIRK